MRVERDRTQAYLDVAHALLVLLYADGMISFWTSASRQVLGDRAGDLVGNETGSTRWCRRSDRDAAREAFEALVAESETVTHYEGEVLTRGGKRRRIAWQATSLTDPKAAWSSCSRARTSPTRTRRGRAAQLAFFDALTGLPNRAQFEPRLRARRHPRATARPRGRTDPDRPRQLQARQPAWPRRRRPAAAARGRTAARHRGRVGLPSPAAAATSSGAAGLRPSRASVRCRSRESIRRVRGPAHQAVHRLARRVPRGGQHRHLGLPRRRRRGRGAAPGTPTWRWLERGRGRAASTVYAGITHDPLERLSLSRRLRRAIAHSELALHYQPIVDGQRPAALDGGAAALARPRARARQLPTPSSRPPRRWACSTRSGRG